MRKTKALCILFSLASVLCFLFSTGQAQAQTDHKLIDKGFRIFTQEDWNGNGRTCGTCHPAENNFTIDPAFIASLPKDNPLFVAEFNPHLSKNFENPMQSAPFSASFFVCNDLYGGV